MDNNIKLIYTEDGKNRLSELKENYANIIEETVKENKYVPGDKSVEITASDIEFASRSIKIIRVDNKNKFNKSLRYGAIAYILLGLILILYDLFRPSLSILKDIISNTYLFLGFSLILTGVAIVVYLRFREKKMQSYEARFERRMRILPHHDHNDDYAYSSYDLAMHFLRRSTAYIRRGQYEVALETLNRAIKIKPQLAEAWLNRGVALDKLDQYDDALEALNKAIEIKPQLAEAWLNKGNVLSKLDQYDGALEALNRAIEINPQLAEAWLNKGVALDKLGQHEQAILAYDKAKDLE